MGRGEASLSLPAGLCQRRLPRWQCSPCGNRNPPPRLHQTSTEAGWTLKGYLHLAVKRQHPSPSPPGPCQRKPAKTGGLNKTQSPHKIIQKCPCLACAERTARAGVGKRPLGKSFRRCAHVPGPGGLHARARPRKQQDGHTGDRGQERGRAAAVVQRSKPNRHLLSELLR